MVAVYTGCKTNTEETMISETDQPEVNNEDTLVNHEPEQGEIEFECPIETKHKNFVIHAKGLDYLEVGIVIILEAYDVDNNLLWMQCWSGVHVTELATNSEIAFYEDRLYIVVDGTLNAIDESTGKKLWDAEGVGRTCAAPIVDEEGTIYIAGQYRPQLSAVNPGGEILWQISSDELDWVEYVYFEDDIIVLRILGGIVRVDKKGNIIEESQE